MGKQGSYIDKGKVGCLSIKNTDGWVFRHKYQSFKVKQAHPHINLAKVKQKRFFQHTLVQAGDGVI